MANRKQDSTFAIPALLEAALFGAEEHCKCRRKDADATPYINHPIKVARLLPRAKVIKLADKIANLSDIVASPPSGWPHKRRTAYLEWSNSVIAGCRGHNDPLEALYDWVADEVAGALKRAS